MGDGDERVEALRGRLMQLKATAARIEAQMKEVRAKLRVCDSPTNMLMDLASRGPFTLPQAVEHTGRRYDHVSVTAGDLVRQGKLFRLGRGTYAAHPEPPVELPVDRAEPEAVDLPSAPPQAPSPAPKAPKRAGRPAKETRTPQAEPTAVTDPREWMDTDEEGLPEVTAPIGTQAWRFEMRARREARREREEARREEEHALHDQADPVLLDGAVGT